MSDELSPVEEQDQPQVSDETAPAEADSTPADTEANNPEEGDEESFSSLNLDEVPEEYRDYVDTYRKSLQADYTRKRQADSAQIQEAQQALAIVEALQDPTRANEIFSILGYELAEDDDNGDDLEFGDDDGPLDPNDRLDAFEANLAREREEAQQFAQQQQQLAEQQEEEINVAEQVADLEEELNREFSEEEINLLWSYGNQYTDANGNPDIKAAYTVLDGIIANRHRELIKPKADAPRALRQGTPASQDYDTSTDEGRLKAMEAAAARAMQSST